MPSAEFGDARAALEHLLDGAISVRAAVAFVTGSGVEVLARLLHGRPQVKLEIVARGAPVTEPEALTTLRDELGARVAVIAGPQASGFHPKLWLLRGERDLAVLSGSGNLTAGGLRENREQFEVAHYDDAAQIAAQERRFEKLTEGAIPLDRFEDSIAWSSWTLQLRRRAEIAARLRELDEELASAHSESREADKQALLDDLWQLYERIREAKIPKQDGSPYVPGNFRLELEGHRGAAGAVSIASKLCRGTTDGFTRLVDAGHPDLTVEWLVVDVEKPYHSLFRREIREASAQRLREAGVRLPPRRPR